MLNQKRQHFVSRSLIISLFTVGWTQKPLPPRLYLMKFTYETNFCNIFCYFGLRMRFAGSPKIECKTFRFLLRSPQLALNSRKSLFPACAAKAFLALSSPFEGKTLPSHGWRETRHCADLGPILSDVEISRVSFASVVRKARLRVQPIVKCHVCLVSTERLDAKSEVKKKTSQIWIFPARQLDNCEITHWWQDYSAVSIKVMDNWCKKWWCLTAVKTWKGGAKRATEKAPIKFKSKSNWAWEMRLRSEPDGMF